jgi:hypothetical protein
MSLGDVKRELVEIGDDTDRVANGSMTVKVENFEGVSQQLAEASLELGQLLEKVSGLSDALDGAAAAGHITQEELDALAGRLDGMGARNKEHRAIVDKYTEMGEAALVDGAVERYKEGIGAAVGALAVTNEMLSKMSGISTNQRAEAVNQRDYAHRIAQLMRDYASTV